MSHTRSLHVMVVLSDLRVYQKHHARKHHVLNIVYLLLVRRYVLVIQNMSHDGFSTYASNIAIVPANQHQVDQTISYKGFERTIA